MLISMANPVVDKEEEQKTKMNTKKGEQCIKEVTLIGLYIIIFEFQLYSRYLIALGDLFVHLSCIGLRRVFHENIERV